MPLVKTNAGMKDINRKTNDIIFTAINSFLKFL